MNGMQVSDSEIKWSMSRLPVFSRMLDAVCLAAKAGAQQAVVSDANTVSIPPNNHNRTAQIIRSVLNYVVKIIKT